jgi:methyltransferase (TIGR00027 family)
MGPALGDLAVFEVDDPPLQEWKRRRIRELGLELPPQLHFVPCDFERSSIENALAAHGFLDDDPCFVSWLGVTQYLTRDAIIETLRWCGSRPAGSELVLSYLESNAMAAALRSSAGKSGITFVSDFSTTEMTHLVETSGFSRVEHLSPEEANELYFRERGDGLRAPGHPTALERNGLSMSSRSPRFAWGRSSG